MTELVNAVWSQDAARVVELLPAGADPNRAERDGRSPLEWAVRGMHRATSVALLEAGADPNAACAPLVIAADLGSIGLVRLLLEHGADPSQRDEGGRNALEAAEAKVGVDIERALTEGMLGDGPVDVRREPRAEGSELIEVWRRSAYGSRGCTASENGHAQIAALLRGA